MKHCCDRNAGNNKRAGYRYFAGRLWQVFRWSMQIPKEWGKG